MTSTELEIDSLLPTQRFDRREFIRAGVGVGFAAAVLPVAAQTAIKTDVTGLTAGEVTIKSGQDSIPAYRAFPADKKQAPVVLVVSEIFGVHEHIADLCRRLAKKGYYAIAPELFIRQGDVTNKGTIKEVIDVVALAPDTQVMADLDACVEQARKEGADASRLAITGFCWGGRVVWLYSAHNPKLKAGVAWYGRLVNAFNPKLQPKNPIDYTAELHAPVLGLYAGKDDGIPLESIDRMKAALATGSAAAKASEFVIYPEAQHAFNADYRPSYRKDAAEDGWTRMLAWFARFGV